MSLEELCKIKELISLLRQHPEMMEQIRRVLAEPDTNEGEGVRT